MINTDTVSTAKQLKKVADSAYLIFKKNPTVENSQRWATANRSYRDFCTIVFDNLIKESSDPGPDIVENFDQYKTCSICGAELLYLTSENTYIASSDFVEDFPGWCYTCLAEHCTNTDCSKCTVSTDPGNCSFSEVKEYYLKEK